MTDTLTQEQRSALMSRIRGKNTRPEIALRKALRRLGVRYRSHRRIAGATVDVVLPERRTIILVHGCFWHGCKAHYKPPRSRIRFWARKLAGNRARDRRQVEALHKANWTVLVVWEHALRRDPDAAVYKMLTQQR